MEIPVIDECGQQTPAGSSLNFSVKDTVSAAFTYNIKEGCKIDTMLLFHDGATWRKPMAMAT